MKNKKRLAAEILNTSAEKVRIRDDALADVKKAITRSDMRGLIAVHKIWRVQPSHQSRGRARKKAQQKRKGRQSGKGSRKGRKYSLVSSKDRWISRIRVQRGFLKELKIKKIVSPANYRMLYLKTKGGYFRNKRHIKLYLTEHNLIEKNAEKKETEATVKK